MEATATATAEGFFNDFDTYSDNSLAGGGYFFENGDKIAISKPPSEKFPKLVKDLAQAVVHSGEDALGQQASERQI